MSKSEELGLKSKEGKAGRGWDINEVMLRMWPRSLLLFFFLLLVSVCGGKERGKSCRGIQIVS